VLIFPRRSQADGEPVNSSVAWRSIQNVCGPRAACRGDFRAILGNWKCPQTPGTIVVSSCCRSPRTERGEVRQHTEALWRARKASLPGEIEKSRDLFLSDLKRGNTCSKRNNGAPCCNPLLTPEVTALDGDHGESWARLLSVFIPACESNPAEDGY